MGFPLTNANKPLISFSERGAIKDPCVFKLSVLHSQRFSIKVWSKTEKPIAQNAEINVPSPHFSIRYLRSRIVRRAISDPVFTMNVHRYSDVKSNAINQNHCALHWY